MMQMTRTSVDKNLRPIIKLRDEIFRSSRPWNRIARLIFVKYTNRPSLCSMQIIVIVFYVAFLRFHCYVPSKPKRHVIVCFDFVYTSGYTYNIYRKKNVNSMFENYTCVLHNILRNRYFIICYLIENKF